MYGVGGMANAWYVAVFVIVFVVLSPVAYSMIHGDTTIPQLQRYTEVFPSEKGPTSIMLFIATAALLVWPWLRTPFRKGVRIPKHPNRRYRLSVEGRGFAAKIGIQEIHQKDN